MFASSESRARLSRGPRFPAGESGVDPAGADVSGADAASATKASILSAWRISWLVFPVPLIPRVPEPPVTSRRASGRAAGAGRGLRPAGADLQRDPALPARVPLPRDAALSGRRPDDHPMASVYGAEIGVDRTRGCATFMMVQFLWRFVLVSLRQRSARASARRALFVALAVSP